MIVSGNITPAQKKQSQKAYNLFALLNGMSYMCVGETVIILFAVNLNMPDLCVSVIGAMLYVGYLMLPLGKKVAAYAGASYSQAVFWVLRNVAGLTVASAAPVVYFLGGKTGGIIAVFLILAGAFAFYGFRAAGIALSQPLLQEWTEPAERGTVIAVSQSLFSTGNIISLLAISLLLKMFPGIRTITGIIVAGSAAGMFSAGFLTRICETEDLRRSAKKPLLSQMKHLLHETFYRKIILNMFVCSLALAMTIPVSMLTLKRGYGVADDNALVFAILQFFSCAFFSFAGYRLLRPLAIKRVILTSYIASLLICFSWVFAPAEFSRGYSAYLFLLSGFSSVTNANAIMRYFINTVRKEHQVCMSILTSLFSSAGAGLAGMAVIAVIFTAIQYFTGESGTLTGYRYYFGITGFLLLPGIVPPLILPDHPSPMTYRKQNS